MSATTYTITTIVLAVAIAIGFAMKDRRPPLEPERQSGVVAYACDGDSLALRGGASCEVRLWGVDAPERGESGSERAKIALQRLVENQPVTFIKMDTDRYGRIVARVFLRDGREVNRLMIESGAATEYMRYSRGFYSQ